MAVGKVYLIGAGPGDVELLTLKARRLLLDADVVVYDRLVGAGVIALAGELAKMIDVGKNAGNHKLSQEGINACLVEEAKRGATVVRLKGGDPFVFGRGGEEIEALNEHGISFEVVPGVTSAIAALSYAGIPATHRDCAANLQIITAHRRADYENHVDYAAVAQAGGTMIFLMGVSEIPNICSGLMKAGLSPDTPAAIVENGTLAVQRRILGRLDNLPALANRERVQTPALVVVGEVVRYAEAFDGRSRLPLSTTRVIVTRARAQISRLAQMFREKGAEVLEAPAITIETYGAHAMLKALKHAPDYRYIAFTSPNGVDAMMAHLREHCVDIRLLAGVKLAALGRGTARALEELALQVDYVPEVYDAAHLGEGLARLCKSGDKVLALRAEQGSVELNKALENAGVLLDDVAVYRTREGVAHAGLVREWAYDDKPVYVALGSASCARAFAAAIDVTRLEKTHCVCIGEMTAHAAREAGLQNVTVSPVATLEELVHTTEVVHRQSGCLQGAAM